MALFVVACGQSDASSSASPAPAEGPAASALAEATPSPRPSISLPSPDHPLPVVVDTDLAGDDLFALLVLLRDPAVDVRGVTIAATGEVHCVPGIRNTRRVLAALGRPEVPVACGRENPGPNGRWFPPEWRAGADAFYGVELPAVDRETARDETAPELLARLAGASDAPLTLVTLGPLSNVADAASLDPAFASHLAGIHAMAGTIDAPGNISYGDTSPADGVEWNVGADPDAMAAVLALDIPMTLVGLDATNDVPVPADIVDQLSADHGAAGADIAYEMYVRTPFLADGEQLLLGPAGRGHAHRPVRRRLGGHDGRDGAHGSRRGAPVARSRRPARPGGDVRRPRGVHGPLPRRACGRARPRSNPFAIAGSMEVRWDGTSCTVVDPPDDGRPGRGHARATRPSGDVALLMGGAAPPKTWADVVAFVQHADLADPNLKAPDWIVQVPVDLSASAGTRSTAFAPIPAGKVGVLCATGTYPDLTFYDGGSFTVGG